MISVEGVTDVVGDLTRAATTIKRRSGDVLGRVADDVKDEAQRDVPVVTGTLQRSITSEKVNETAYEVGSDVNYAVFVEFGTSRQAPQPFLYPSADRYESDLLDDLAEQAADV